MVPHNERMNMDSKKRMSQVVKFHVDRMKPYLGATITGFVVDDSDGETYAGFVIKTRDGKTHQVIPMADPEGNGPGWLEFACEDDEDKDGGK